MDTFTASWFVALGAFIAGPSAWGLWRGASAHSWPAVPGRVVETGVRRHRGGMTGGRYAPTVRYEYEVAGSLLTASRITFGTLNLGTTPEGAAEVLGLKPGDAVRVHYNPRNPGDAVLRPGAAPSTYLLLATGVFFLSAGLGQVLAASRS